MRSIPKQPDADILKNQSEFNGEENLTNKSLPYLLPFRCLVFILTFIIGSLITNKSLDGLSNIWSIVASVVNIITIVMLVLITKKNGGFAKLINYEKGKTKPKQIVGMI